MIVFDHVGFSYAGAHEKRPALTDVSISIEPGAIVALVGGNGSGKSTMARLMDGLLQPTEGLVTVDGVDTRDSARIWDIRRSVGMVFQDPDDQIVGTVVEEDVAFGPENLGVPADELRERVRESLAAVGMAGFERREPHLLSEGQKQRVAIAGALAMRPAYLVLDEPTAMLDPRGRQAVMDLLEDLAHDGGHGVVHISHDSAGVARADRVIALDKGAVFFDGLCEELLSDPMLMERAGLSMTSIGAVAVELRRLGRDLPGCAMQAEGLVDALWP